MSHIIEAQDLLDVLVEQSPQCVWPVRRALNKIGTIDAVPVVRCKDCISWKRIDKRIDVGFCQMHCDPDSECERMMTENDYCSYGEKMDGGETE